MSAPTSSGPDRLASLPKPSPTPEGRIWLRDLPLPAEALPYVEEYCRRFWFWERAAARRRVEEDLKLQYYFGGHDVYYLATPKGLAILHLGLLGEGGFHRLRDQLPVEERDQLRLRPVEKWNSEAPLPSCYDI
jgi:hypothetical protein